MTKSERIAEALVRPINPSVIIILGIYTVVWGLWIANPFWAVFGQAPLYSVMAHLAGEAVWGSIAIVAGAVITRGAVKPNYRNLHVGAFVAFLHWFGIAILYLLGDWMNTGGITSLMVAAYAAIVWVNIKVNRHLYP